MARTLRRTVIAGGVTYARGSKETAELAKAVSNPNAWEGEQPQASVEEPAPPKVFGPDSDPAGFTVAEVLAYLETAEGAELGRVLEAEAAGKNRSSLTGS